MGFAQPPEIELVENGSFESGSLTGWTTESLSGGFWSVYSGDMVNGNTVLPPPDGTFAAVSAPEEIASSIIFQDIELPETSEITCSAIVYYENESGVFVFGDGLNVVDVPNQQYRVDIMDPEAPDFDTGGGVLLSLFQTMSGDPNSLGYTTLDFDLTQFAGQTVRIRAAVAANLGSLFGSLDAVTCTAIRQPNPIPTLSQWGLIAMAGLIGIAGLLAVRMRKTAA